MSDSAVIEREPEVADEVVGPAASGTALALVNPLQSIKDGLAALKAESDSATWDVETTAGEAAAREFRQRCVKIRTATDAAYERGNKPLLEAQRQARTLVAAIKEAVSPIEAVWDKKIKDKEERKAREKAEREEAERKRLAEIRARIAAIAGAVLSVATSGSVQVKSKWDELSALEISEESFGDFAPEAEGAKLRALSELSTLLARRIEVEEGERKLAEERAELERRQADMLRREREAAAELERQRQEVAAERERAEQAAAAERRRQAEARAEQERRDAAARAEHKRQVDAFEAERAAERERVATAQRVERERLAEIERVERQRQADIERAEQERRDEEQRQRAAQIKAEAAAQATPEPLAQAIAEEPAGQGADVAEYVEAHAEMAAAELPPGAPQRPSDAEILSVLCTAYAASPLDVIDWIEEFDIYEQALRVREGGAS